MSFLRKIRRLIIDSFGFSKTETNGFMILILIVFLTAILPRIYFRNYETKSKPVSNQTLEQWAAEMRVSIKKKERKPFYSQPKLMTQSNFDPNEASVEVMNSGGLPKYLAERIVKYRQKGGSFKEANDLKKMYGMTDSIYSIIQNFVIIVEIEEKQKFRDEVIKKPRAWESEVEVSIELNSATKEEFQRIRGIGSVLSERITQYRNLLGGFYSTDQLKEVYGLKEEVIEQIIQQSIFDGGVNQITINTDSIKKLIGHPYIDYNLARAVINYRRVHGVYKSIDQLLEIKMMNDSLYQKLSPYLSL